METKDATEAGLHLLWNMWLQEAWQHKPRIHISQNNKHASKMEEHLRSVASVMYQHHAQPCPQQLLISPSLWQSMQQIGRATHLVCLATAPNLSTMQCCWLVVCQGTGRSRTRGVLVGVKRDLWGWNLETLVGFARIKAVMQNDDSVYVCLLNTLSIFFITNLVLNFRTETLIQSYDYFVF